MKTPRIIRRRRAVSPILAAILLIGLAVAAGAVLFVVVLPLISGTADVQFVSAVAADRNSDGLIDQITVQVQNKGSEKDIFSEGTISLTGWSAAGNIEIGLANPVSLVFKTTDVTAQVQETSSVSITLAFDKSDDIAITETNIDMDHATTLSDSDMLIDFTDSYDMTRDSVDNFDHEYIGTAAATHSGTGGYGLL
ncbi:MAG: archaellin/type IV pilin N-terminal domain-containing protein, partial [Candidatus Hodarchaeales archaeon]